LRSHTRAKPGSDRAAGALPMLSWTEAARYRASALNADALCLSFFVLGNASGGDTSSSVSASNSRRSGWSGGGGACGG
jgi:hypothetical protein